MSKGGKPMFNFTAEEKNIWNAAFAAAIITDFRHTLVEELELEERLEPHYDGSPWQKAKSFVSGTQALELANLAVEKFREVTQK